MQGAARAAGERGGRRGGLTERSQRLLLINHCSVFDLSFAKGGKRGGGGWPVLLLPLLTLSREEGRLARERETAGGEEQIRKREAEVWRRHHNTFLMKSEINQLHGLLDESGISQPPGGISCSAWLAGPDKDR